MNCCVGLSWVVEWMGWDGMARCDDRIGVAYFRTGQDRIGHVSQSVIITVVSFILSNRFYLSV